MIFELPPIFCRLFYYYSAECLKIFHGVRKKKKFFTKIAISHIFFCTDYNIFFGFSRKRKESGLLISTFILLLKYLNSVFVYPYSFRRDTQRISRRIVLEKIAITTFFPEKKPTHKKYCRKLYPQIHIQF